MTSKAPSPEIRKRGRPQKYFSAEQRRKARTRPRQARIWVGFSVGVSATATVYPNIAEISQCSANTTPVPDETVPGPVLLFPIVKATQGRIPFLRVMIGWWCVLPGPRYVPISCAPNQKLELPAFLDLRDRE